MKKVVYILFVLALLVPINVTAAVANSSGYTSLKIYLFSNNNCKECEEEKECIEDYKEDKFINVEYINIKDNEKLYNEIKESLKIKKDNVPLVIIGSNYFLGFNDRIKGNLIEAIKAYEENKDYCDVVTKIKNKEDIKECLKVNKNIYKDNIFISVIIMIIAIIVLVIVGRLVVKKIVKG